MYKIKTKIGNSVLEFEDKDFKKVCKFSVMVRTLPKKCTCCQSDDVFLNHRGSKGGEYLSLRCGKCGAEFPIRQHREEAGGGVYCKYDDKMEVYKKTENQPQPQENNGEQVPF